MALRVTSDPIAPGCETIGECSRAPVPSRFGGDCWLSCRHLEVPSLTRDRSPCWSCFRNAQRLVRSDFRPEYVPCLYLGGLRRFKSCRSSVVAVLFPHNHILLNRFRRVDLLVLILHVPPPIIFPGERLPTSLFRIRTSNDCAVVLPSLVVLVVDVAVKMCLRAEALFAVRALVRSFVIAFMMAV